MGKVIGGGLPVGAYGGRKDIMSMVSPAGPMYQAGTLSGNPLAMTAGIKTLEILSRPGAYEHLQKVTKMLVDGLEAAAKETGHDFCASNISGELTVCMAWRNEKDDEQACLQKRHCPYVFCRHVWLLLLQGTY